MTFPTSLTNAVAGVTEIKAEHLNNLETKVGIDGSAVAASLDYVLKNAASVDPGHEHTLAAGANDVTATAAEMNLLDLAGLTAGHVLRATGAEAAAWGAIQAGDLPTIPVANGGTGLTSLAQGDLVYGSAANTFSALAKSVTSGHYLKNSGADNNPAWGAIAAGDLPAAIDAAKLADGSVSNTEFQYLANVTSDLQSQIDGMAKLAGRASGQTLNGGTGASDNLTLSSTAHATKGAVLLAQGGGNVGIGGSTFGSSAAKVLAISTGTAPTTSPSDTVQLWSADRGGTAGKAGLHLRSEDGTSFVFGDYTGINTTTPSYIFSIQGTAATDLPTYSAEFLSESGWTSTDWTGSWAAGWTHVVGNTTALSQSTAAVAGTKYQIAYTVTGRTAGTFNLSFGGESLTEISATGTFGPTATSTAGLTITPTSDFNGTILISIKSITAAAPPVMGIKNSAGTALMEIRAGSGSLNMAVGYNALTYVTTGYQNVAVGPNSLRFITTGYQNVAIGISALNIATVGYRNTAVGVSALEGTLTGYDNAAMGYGSLNKNTSGHSNTAFGTNALYYTTTGYQNAAIGLGALINNTTGYNNAAIGVKSLYSNTTGYSNVAIGYNAGRYITGDIANQTSNTSVYIGISAKAFADGDTNEIVIGANAIGAGSNSITLGNTSIVTTILRGNVGVGQTTFGTSAAKVVAVGTGTAPSSSPADAIQMYSADQAAGNACPHFRTEGGAIIKLFQGAALTTALTDITHTAPGTPDYAVQDLTNSGGFGFVTKDEGNTVLSVIANLQARVNELETRLKAHGLLA